MWKEQYKRMLRGFDNIKGVYDKNYSQNDPFGKEVFIGQGEYPEKRDIIIHFFQDCFHLRDWILNDKTLDLTTEVIDQIDQVCYSNSPNPNLQICRDVANASKHLTIDKMPSVDKNTNISASGTAYVPELNANFSLKFDIEMPNKGSKIDAYELASKCIDEWNEILKNYNIK